MSINKLNGLEGYPHEIKLLQSGIETENAGIDSAGSIYGQSIADGYYQTFLILMVFNSLVQAW